MVLVFFNRLGWLLLLLTLQVVFFNHIHLLGYATPLPYLFLLLLFRKDSARYSLLFWGFFAGLAVDLFSNTPGLFSASMTFSAFVQPYLLNRQAPKDCAEDLQPGYNTMGFWAYIRFVIYMVLLHNLVFFGLDFLSFFNWVDVLYCYGGSSLLTIFIILAFGYMHEGK